MFWAAVWDGIVLLTRWQIWVGSIFYLLGVLAYLWSTGSIGSDVQVDEAKGCLAGLGESFLHGILLTIVITWLLPLLLGFGFTTPIGRLYNNIGAIGLVGVSATAIGFFVAFVPVVGQLLYSVPGGWTFVIGVAAFRILVEAALPEIIAQEVPSADIYPGLWESLGFLLIAGLVVLAQLLFLTYGPKNESRSRLDEALGGVVSAAGTLLPVFMYASYVGNAIQAVIGT